MTYEGLSYWLETVGEPLTPRPALTEDLTVDVAIVGAGYSGLWTAYYLLSKEPGLSVAVLEAEIAGYGASGRNGGWCSSRFPVDPGVLERRYGAEIARATIEASVGAVAEVGRVCEAEGIDADFRINGILSFAQGDAQMASVRATHAAYERLGLGEKHRLLDGQAARARVSVPGMAGGLFTPFSGAVHPAKLARGLARAVERRGGVIFERTRVRRVEPGQTPRAVTEGGVVTARRAVVLAAEAYLPKLPGWERAVLPMSSTIVMTKPLSAAQWDAIGWQGGEGIGSQAFTVNYFTKTPDGRILYGSRGAPYVYGSATEGGEAQLRRTEEKMRHELRGFFPVLDEDSFSHAWGGHLGVTRDWTPSVDFDPEQRIACLYGYTGRGVSTTNLSARLLSDILLGRDSDLRTLPIASRRSRRWEPEPFRWMGVRYVQDAFRRMDEARDGGRPMPLDAPLARRLGSQ